MRVIELVDRDSNLSESDVEALFCGAPANKPRTPADEQQLPRLIRQAFDPIAAITWLVMVPVAAILGWYGLYRLILAAVHAL